MSRIPRRDSKSLVPTVNLLDVNLIQEFVQRESLLSRIASSSDTSLSRLKKYIVSGWPKHIPADILPYAKSREEYSIQEGIIFRGLRIVPPAYLRSHILHLLHTDHPGITHMLQLACQYFWWPKVDSDINAFVQRCATCQIYARKRSKFNLSSWEDSRSFLERVHVDIAHWQGYRFVVFVDSFSKWVDIQYLKDLSAASLTNTSRRIFKYIGLLLTTLVSDNGTNFTSKEFLKYLLDNYVHHVFTPPRHHASNG